MFYMTAIAIIIVVVTVIITITERGQTAVFKTQHFFLPASIIIPTIETQKLEILLLGDIIIRYIYRIEAKISP